MSEPKLHPRDCTCTLCELRSDPEKDTYRLLDHLDIVQAGPDGVHVHEDLALTEVAFQSVEDSAGVSGAVIPPVADEDLWHNPPSFGNGYWDCLG